RTNGLKAGAGFPRSWLCRVEELLSLHGDLYRYALVFFAYNLDWFFAIDSGWTEKHLLSVLNLEREDQNAFWAGFFWGAKTPDVALYMRLKPHLLTLTQQRSLKQRDKVQVLSALLLAGWGSLNLETGERCVASAEMRECLSIADDDFRSFTLWH